MRTNAEQLRERHVTAEIVQDSDGTRRTEYRVGGRAYTSVKSLKAALGVAT